MPLLILLLLFGVLVVLGIPLHQIPDADACGTGAAARRPAVIEGRGCAATGVRRCDQAYDTPVVGDQGVGAGGQLVRRTMRRDPTDQDGAGSTRTSGAPIGDRSRPACRRGSRCTDEIAEELEPPPHTPIPQRVGAAPAVRRRAVPAARPPAL